MYTEPYMCVIKLTYICQLGLLNVVLYLLAQIQRKLSLFILNLLRGICNFLSLHD